MTYLHTLNAAWQAHLAPRDRRALSVVSTFAGCGGSSLGYSMAGYRERLAVEFHPAAAAIFQRNFPGVPVFAGDIATLTVKRALQLTGLKPRELDVLDGSPPCQGYSPVGKRQFSDPRNQLFLEFVRLLTGFKPRGFVLENVPGLVSGKMRLIFRDMWRALERAGYRLHAAKLNAKYFGVPQDRERLIVIGLREDQDHTRFSWPTPTTPRPLRVQNAVLDLPDSAPPKALAPVNRRIWKHAGFGQDGGSLGLQWPHARSASHFSHIKLNPYRPSPTLTKQGSYNFLHWAEPRSLSLAEAKRIGSFPDAFQLEGPFQDQWGGIGNSVPPLFMRAIAGHLADLLRAGRARHAA